MTNAERLSALIDNELSVEESREVLDLVLRDPELSRRWQRYHRMRDSLNGYVGASDAVYSESLVAGVSTAIDAGKFDRVDGLETREQPTVVRIDRGSNHTSVNPDSAKPDGYRSNSDFWAWSSGFAMAATVAAIVLFGLKFGELSDPGTEQGGQPTVAIKSSSPVTNGWDRQVENGNLRWTQSGESVVSEDQARLNELLVRHGEFVAVSGMNGLSGYARFVSFDARER